MLLSFVCEGTNGADVVRAQKLALCQVSHSHRQREQNLTWLCFARWFVVRAIVIHRHQR